VIRLSYGVPAYRGQVLDSHIEQALNLLMACLKSQARNDGHSFLWLGRSAVTRSCFIELNRNRMIYCALEVKADWLLMVDADVYHFQASDILRMIGDANERGAAAVAPPVRIRGRNVHAVYRGATIVPPPKGSMAPVERIGTSMMALNLRWLAENWPEQPWFTTTYCAGRVPDMVGEDLTFCDGVRERGGVILADGRFEPEHVG
jgi:hypothetical protein